MSTDDDKKPTGTDEWPLGDAEKPEPPPRPSGIIASQSMQSISPSEAAYEAARIAGELVGDPHSEHGAAIVAAAAAGAAIEAARAARRDRDSLIQPPPTLAPPTDPITSDPVTTVRMARDRVLKQLADDIAERAEAVADAAPAIEPVSEAPRRPRLPSGQIAPADDEDDELDPVAIAAAAIGRFRERARTDLAEMRVHYNRHDIFVLVAALAILVAAGRFHQALVTPPTATFDEHGLSFQHSQAWLAPEPTPLPAPRLMHDTASPTAAPAKNDALYHVELISSLTPTARMEIRIDKKPAWSNIVTGLDLDRRTRWGELYTLDDSNVRNIAEHDWLRTAYRYAHVADKNDVPRVDRAIEYATIDRDQIYVLTLFGSDPELEKIEDVVAPSLRVQTKTALPLVPQTGHLSQRTYPNAVARAFDSTVMIVVADLVDGRLLPRGGGSGVIVGADGSILTNYHVLYDKAGRLHDVFVVGRFSDRDQAPQLQCAGKPSRSKLQRDVDLALVKCDLDLDGRAWIPAQAGGVWATLLEARMADIKMGQRIWVLGYPDAGGGGLTLGQGEIEGWTGPNGAAGKDYLKTNAFVSNGNSGGPVVDDQGRLVGIASQKNTKVTVTGEVVETTQKGMVRPIAAASDLLAIAATGWTPREGHTDVELTPSAVEAPAEGVHIQTRVLDAATEAPVKDALLMILRPGVSASEVDVNRLDDQVLAYGKTNSLGEVDLKQPVPVPGAYSVMVVAKGYEPLVGDGELHLDAKTPSSFDPWGKIWLRSR